jgi:hypothetical protein
VLSALAVDDSARSRLARSVKICAIRVAIEDVQKAFNKSLTDADAILAWISRRGDLPNGRAT